MDGFSGWDVVSNTPYIILGDDKGSAVRSRFDVAHELGHLILHRNLSPKCIHNPVNNKLIESKRIASLRRFYFQLTLSRRIYMLLA